MLPTGAGPPFPGFTFPEAFRDKHGDEGIIVWGPDSQSQKLHVVGVHQLPGCALLGQVSLLCASVGRQILSGWGWLESPRRRFAKLRSQDSSSSLQLLKVKVNCKTPGRGQQSPEQ